MSNLIEKGLLTGLGLLSMTREKAKEVVDELSQRGEVQKHEAEDWVERLVQRGEEERKSLRELIRDEVKHVLDDLGVATKDDLDNLAIKLEDAKKSDKK